MQELYMLNGLFNSDTLSQSLLFNCINNQKTLWYCCILISYNTSVPFKDTIFTSNRDRKIFWQNLESTDPDIFPVPGKYWINYMEIKYALLSHLSIDLPCFGLVHIPVCTQWIHNQGWSFTTYLAHSKTHQAWNYNR